MSDDDLRLQVAALEERVPRSSRAPRDVKGNATLILALGAAVATAVATAWSPLSAKVDRTNAELVALRTEVSEIRTTSDARDRAWREWAAETQAWQISLYDRMNVSVRTPDGLPPPTPLQVTPPRRAKKGELPGKLRVDTPPPAPPPEL